MPQTEKQKQVERRASPAMQIFDVILVPHALCVLSMWGAHELIEMNSGETELSDAQIFERETAAIRAADVIVAEVTTPSLGVGYILATAVQQRKKVLALYQGENLLKLSSMIKGDPRIHVVAYKNEEIKQVLTRALG